MFNYYTYSLGEISVVDRSLLVRHPPGSKYSGEVATAQLIEFLKQLTPAEKAQSALLDAVVRLHDRIQEAGTRDPAGGCSRQARARAIAPADLGSGKPCEQIDADTRLRDRTFLVCRSVG